MGVASLHAPGGLEVVLSDKSRQKLHAWLQARSWPLRRSRDMARWQVFVQQVILDHAREFDAEAVKQIIYDRLGARVKACGRFKNEVDLRLRLATALVDFSVRANQRK